MTAGAWTEDRVNKLRVLWMQGLSASQIAKELNKLPGVKLTRNAVISKRDRVGLPKRAEPNRSYGPRPKKARVKAAPSAPRNPRPVIVTRAPVHDLEPIRFENGRTAGVADLNDSMCKFPYGDPQDADFAFCGRGAVHGPYCKMHARLAYEKGRAAA